ncbi:hypothetical protein [Rhizobium lusitanum]|uniref:Uncharacterized protein n=1 Tax=Rhizobium lusitanum TaxID=293958 RepID=A0A7X0MD47_9HYPH|nr:hypothetical protein [Rhizobium lusitanum]MBB6486066.1 hypothetical protein [Rhizobium lusitanum]
MHPAFELIGSPTYRACERRFGHVGLAMPSSDAWAATQIGAFCVMNRIARWFCHWILQPNGRFGDALRRKNQIDLKIKIDLNILNLFVFL